MKTAKVEWLENELRIRDFTIAAVIKNGRKWIVSVQEEISFRSRENAVRYIEAALEIENGRIEVFWEGYWLGAHHLNNTELAYCTLSDFRDQKYESCEAAMAAAEEYYGVTNEEDC